MSVLMNCRSLVHEYHSSCITCRISAPLPHHRPSIQSLIDCTGRSTPFYGFGQSWLTRHAQLAASTELFTFVTLYDGTGMEAWYAS